MKDIVNGFFITSFLFALSIFIPVIGFIGSLFIPLPILFYRVKLGRQAGLIIPALVVFLMVVWIGGISLDILFFIELLFVGFVLGELIELNLSIERTLLYASGSVLITAIGTLFFYSILTGTGVIAAVESYVDQNLELTIILYQEMGVSEENIRIISDSLAKIRNVLVAIIPSLVAASTLLLTWFNLLLAKPLLVKRAIHYPDFGKLNRWKAPEFLVWAVIISGILLILSDGPFRLIGLNGLLILLPIYFYQGIAIVSFYFEKKQIPRYFRVFVYILIIIQQILLLFVIGLGFFDLWLNFRRLDKQSG